jgi:hypothetical protein
MKVISDEGNEIKNERIIDIMKQKIYERYYLKQHFDLEIHE